MLFTTLLLAGTASASCLHGVFKREEGEVEIPFFGYEDTFGPLNWASLAAENEACKTGANQSPINIGMYPFTISHCDGDANCMVQTAQSVSQPRSPS